MNNDETTKKNAVENNSLMRKTKAQLVEIILRKDSIEKNLRADIKCTEQSLNYEKRQREILTFNYEEMCDEKASIECELNTTIKKQKVFMLLLAIIFIISVIANITLYLM